MSAELRNSDPALSTAVTIKALMLQLRVRHPRFCRTGPRSSDPGIIPPGAPDANLQPVFLKKNTHNKGRVLVALVSVALTAGPWQEVDRRVKYGWRLALPLVPRVWTKTERLFIAQRPGGVTGCVALAQMQANTALTCASWNPPC